MPVFFKKKRIWVLALSAALSACGGGGESSSGGVAGGTLSTGNMENWREQAAALENAGTGMVPPRGVSQAVDATGPVLKNFLASKTDIFWPDAVTLSVQAVDVGSGVSKVEFWELGKNKPLAVFYGPPYFTTLSMGAQDNGAHAYYVRAYDWAFDKNGAAAFNLTSNADTPLRVSVAYRLQAWSWPAASLPTLA